MDLKKGLKQVLQERQNTILDMAISDTADSVRYYQEGKVYNNAHKFRLWRQSGTSFDMSNTKSYFKSG